MSSNPLGPEKTPHPLKVLIWTTAGVSLLSALIPRIQPLLALSLSGIQHFYLWQLVSYLFVHPTLGGITFPFLLHLAFNLYLLWVFGTSLLARTSKITFFSLYFGSGLFAGLLALGTMALFHLPFSLAGSSGALYALLMTWMILNQEAELYLFFAIPFKARWLILALIGSNLLIDLSNSDWVSFFSYAGSALFGYLFAILAYREQSPFPFLNPLERLLLRTLESLRHLGKKRVFYRPTKIYDIHSGDPVIDDDSFMDAMLARVSLHGEDSLTPEEKRRMQSISERKAAKSRK